MKRDKKNTEFATDEPTKQTFSRDADPGTSKKRNEREGQSDTAHPHEDLIINEKKGKSTSL
ncbi:hypothetical protein U1P98_15495 [Lysinibacillus irui]|uniref:Uncharacterized protein n=1 Tax=Lysinibacillus irui TaxID=2998077 RepID=A0AAJ5RP11_9BACI|nr:MULTISPECIES: hypothetical protein [Lysinibacillus]MEA0555279.1 hypothetical protein [Lysinibacillus irui]MEA0562156.1 hypothetical protein [Lysinibacillus irui]MEA0977713.1 hypothetical protein [Lysinibacillus irui]MEA1043867.1 hypothetical protein [Lysinibacillus irui]WDV08580.1 hypothetical protein OU989_08895 [Lysinibacillus irui]